MKAPLYRQALADGWQLAKSHHSLWLFGLFAVFLGQMGLLELLTRVTVAAGNRSVFPLWLSGEINLSLAGYSLPLVSWSWFIWLLFTVIGFSLLFIFVSVVSQGALIQASARWAENKSLPLAGQAWQTGIKHFWRLFFLNVFKKIVICLLGLIVAAATVNALINFTGASFSLFVVLFLLCVLVGMVVSFLTIYAAGYVVVEEYGLGHALFAAWQLFIRHWLVSIEVGLIILALNVVVSLVVMAGFFICYLPTVISWFIAVVTINPALWQAGMIVGSILFMLFVFFVGSVFTVFVVSVWTDLFMKMHRHGIISRLVHWCKR
ncbi:MAG TPA: hypothetical protein VJB37_02720 [Patescibacteria group bacterium]|nr:hypothetical protein [Patescibacteria group bacterium]